MYIHKSISCTFEKRKAIKQKSGHLLYAVLKKFVLREKQRR